MYKLGILEGILFVVGDEGISLNSLCEIMNINLEEAKELIKKNTRHYVKRQYTWFNTQLPVTWFDAEDYDAALSGIISFIESLNSK